MPTESSRSLEPERDVEEELRNRLKQAENAYRAASAEYLKTRQQNAGLLDHPDGAYAVRHAAKLERIAIQKYRRALGAFADFVLRGRTPPAAG